MGGIYLENIDLSGVKISEQYKKVNEEVTEFKEAAVDYNFSKTDKNKQHIIEEYFDSLQAMLGIMNLEGITIKEISDSYEKHLEKIKNRPR